MNEYIWTKNKTCLNVDVVHLNLSLFLMLPNEQRYTKSYKYFSDFFSHYIDSRQTVPDSTKSGGSVLPQRCGDVISEPWGICKV